MNKPTQPTNKPTHKHSTHPTDQPTDEREGNEEMADDSNSILAVLNAILKGQDEIRKEMKPLFELAPRVSILEKFKEDLCAKAWQVALPVFTLLVVGAAVFIIRNQPPVMPGK